MWTIGETGVITNAGTWEASDDDSMHVSGDKKVASATYVSASRIKAKGNIFIHGLQEQVQPDTAILKAGGIHFPDTYFSLAHPPYSF